MRRRSLKTTLAVWLSAVVTLVLLANAAYQILTTRARLRERLEENARLFAALSTEPLCQAWETFHASGFFRFRQVAENLLQRAPDVTAFEILDVNGKVLFHTRELERGEAAALAGGDPALLEALRAIEPSELRGRDQGGERLDVVVPWVEDFGRHRISVVYRVRYSALAGQFRHSSLVTLALTLASLALAAGLGIVLARGVTRPLATLTAGVAAIARGQFERRLDLRTGDELQQVAQAFNDMAAHLQATVAELRRSGERWRSLVEEAPVVVLTTTTEGVVEFVNVPGPLAARARGRTLDELAGGALPPAAREVLRRVRETGQPGAFEVEAPAAAGRGWAWYSVHVGAVREGGTVTGLTVVGVDVTAAREAGQERERLIAELERRNAELERFTYTVSHDLRSPLVTVKGFLGAVERAAEKGQTERVREDLARIRAAADRMDQLLRELLELSRVGRVAHQPEPVPFGELVEEARALVAGRLAQRGVELRVAPDLPSVHGDRRRLVEVLQNLLDNAAKFTGDQPRPRVEVGARAGADGPVFYVRDNGLGIEPRHHEKVFGLFDRLDPKVEGTGIGLALVRRIVEVHGGRVWVESEGPGRGSSFCFTLPGRGEAPGWRPAGKSAKQAP